MNWSQGGMKGCRQTHSWKSADWFLDWTTLEKEDAYYLFLLKFNEIRSDNTIKLSYYFIFQLIAFTLNRSYPLVGFFQSPYLFFTRNTFLLAFLDKILGSCNLLEDYSEHNFHKILNFSQIAESFYSLIFVFNEPNLYTLTQLTNNSIMSLKIIKFKSVKTWKIEEMQQHCYFHKSEYIQHFCALSTFFLIKRVMHIAPLLRVPLNTWGIT